MLHMGYKHIWFDAPHKYHRSGLFLLHSTSFMELAPNQVGWVISVGELYYGLNSASSMNLEQHS